MHRIACLALLVCGTQFLGEAAPAVPSIINVSFSSTKAAVQQMFGPPEHVRQQPSFEIWDYSLGNADENDLGFAWSFYFDEPSGRLTSVTRNFKNAVPVNDLFSADAGKVATSPGPLPTKVLYRSLDGERVLIAVGVSHPSDLCSQVVLMRKSAVQYFYPWLSAQLSAK
jgi:hypothetical protein